MTDRPQYRMKRYLISLFFLPLLIATIAGQTISIAPRIDDLLPRAAQFRRLLASGDRVKAAEFVLQAKRAAFLNNPTTALANFQLLGIDFIDKDRVAIRLSGQNIVSGSTGAELVEPQVVDTWVRDKGNWYFQPDAAATPFSTMFKKTAGTDEAALSEIKSRFKLLTDSIDIGALWQGDRKDVPVPFEYTGDAPIRIVSKVDTPVTMIDSAATQYILKEVKEFKLIAGSDDYDGPFDIPVSFTVYYKSVALDKTIRVKGMIRPLFKSRQEPSTIPPGSKEEFQLFLTNNTDEQADLDGVVTEGAFVMTHFNKHFAPGEEQVLTLKRNPLVAKPGTTIRLLLVKDLKGRHELDVRIH
jgi:hypothetical protein